MKLFEKRKLANGKRIIYVFGIKIYQYYSARAYDDLFLYLEKLNKDNELIQNALSDPHGMGFLELLLNHAHVAQHHKFIFQKMPANAICIDGGANIGAFADICLHKNGIVHAFEPGEEAYNILNEKYKNNSKVILYKKAIHTKNSTVQFYNCQEENDDFLTYSQCNSLIKFSSEEHIHQTASSQIETCDFVEFIKKNFIDLNTEIYVVKLDIEGAEFEVLDSMIDNNVCSHIKYILVETHKRLFADGDEKLNQLKKKIEKNNITNIYLDWI